MTFQTLEKTAQLIHGQLTNKLSSTTMFVTVVYELHTVEARKS